MNHRDRVLAALDHREPDRVPIDLGGTVVTTIAAVTYRDLRDALGLPRRDIYMGDTYQQVAEVDQDVMDKLDVDVAGIYPRPREWQPGRLIDGSPAMVPARWNPQVLSDGSEVVLDSAGNVVMKMPKRGFYFDVVYSPMSGEATTADLDKHLDWMKGLDLAFYLDKSYEELAQEAKQLREHTDYLVVAHFGGQFLGGGQKLRGYSEFMLDLAADPRFAEAVLDRLLEVYKERFEHFAGTVGRYVDVIEVDDDLGMQDGPFLSLSMYRRLIKPRQKSLYAFMKSRCNARLFLHSCGSIYSFLPDLIEVGIDILNPVQVSAKDMDTERLKREFGKDLVFWGGGCDTQRVLPFGTPAQVRDEVRRRMDDLASGGGFVFAPVLNIQACVPIENVVTMYEAVHELGVY